MVGNCMELAKLILEYTKTLIWPITTIILAAAFHEPLRTVLERLRKAGLPGGVSLDFQEQIQETKELSKRAEVAPVPSERQRTPAIPLTEANARMISLGLQPVSSGLDMSYFNEIAKMDPTLALAGLRIEIETLAKNVAVGFKMEVKKTEGTQRLLRRLLAQGAITEVQEQLARRILNLCNKAVHGEPVSRQEAQEVIDAAAVLFEYFLEWLSWGFDDNWGPPSAATPKD